MHHADAAIDAALGQADVLGTLREAFIDFAGGGAAIQARVRTQCGPVKLSTLGAVWAARGIAGAKVYTTLAGRFTFVIVLFSTQTGALLATMEANAITRRRTAAVSLLAVQRFARAGASTLAVFGTGVQARAHADAFARALALREIRIVSRGDASVFVDDVARTTGCEVHAMRARQALSGADLVVTATRSSVPLFAGGWVEPGAMVCAVGSSLPETRELDDALIARASAIVVEWREQALREAGDLVLADASLMARVPVIDLGAALIARDLPRRDEGDIVVFKSVGVGLADIAVAGLAYRHLHGDATA